MEVPRTIIESIYSDIVNSVGYKTTVGPIDKRKVQQRLAGVATKLPSARLARAAWRAAAILTPLTPPPPPPPPPPPAPRLAPQTYNKGSSGQDAKYCVNSPGVTAIGNGRYQDEGGFVYDNQGLCLGGRSGNPVAGLKPADAMDGRGPCDPYNGFPPWPAGSYEV